MDSSDHRRCRCDHVQKVWESGEVAAASSTTAGERLWRGVNVDGCRCGSTACVLTALRCVRDFISNQTALSSPAYTELATVPCFHSHGQYWSLTVLSVGRSARDRRTNWLSVDQRTSNPLLRLLSRIGFAPISSKLLAVISWLCCIWRLSAIIFTLHDAVGSLGRRCRSVQSSPVSVCVWCNLGNVFITPTPRLADCSSNATPLRLCYELLNDNLYWSKR